MFFDFHSFESRNNGKFYFSFLLNPSLNQSHHSSIRSGPISSIYTQIKKEQWTLYLYPKTHIGWWYLCKMHLKCQAMWELYKSTLFRWRTNKQKSISIPSLFWSNNFMLSPILVWWSNYCMLDPIIVCLVQ